MASALYLTLCPHGTPPRHDWKFTIDGTAQSGISHGPLRLAVTSALALAIGSGRGAVVITLPHAAWDGLRARRLVVRHFHEVEQQVRALDVVALRRRWARGQRWRRRCERWRAGLGLPAVWPAMP